MFFTKRIKKLEKRVEELEKRLEEVEKKQNEKTISQLTTGDKGTEQLTPAQILNEWLNGKDESTE